MDFCLASCNDLADVPSSFPELLRSKQSLSDLAVLSLMIGHNDIPRTPLKPGPRLTERRQPQATPMTPIVQSLSPRGSTSHGLTRYYSVDFCDCTGPDDQVPCLGMLYIWAITFNTLLTQIFGTLVLQRPDSWANVSPQGLASGVAPLGDSQCTCLETSCCRYRDLEVYIAIRQLYSGK